jgi:thiol-disulfide isomerase/thioredoxin
MELKNIILIAIVCYVFYFITKSSSSIENFDPNKPTIKLFFATWCYHCEKYMPVWKELSKKHKNKYNFIAIDEKTMSKNEKNKEQIRGFPTLKYCSNNNEIEINNRFKLIEEVEQYNN